ESLVGSIAHLAHGHLSFVAGAWVVPGGWRWVDPIGLAIVAALAIGGSLRAWRRPADRVDLDALAGAVVVALLLGSRLLSPQYLVWAVPFVVLVAARGNRRPAVCLL